MRELVKKLSVIFVTLVFLVSGLTVASVASVQEGSLDESEFTRTVTLYRYGPDKSIRPVRVNIVLAKGQDLGEAIVEKCSELVINDVEMQNFISSYNAAINITNISLWSHVKSWGTGEHWQSLLRFRIPLFILLRFSMFQDVPIWYKIFGINVIPFVHCNYMNDDDATTTIETLPIPVRPNQTTTVIEGRHNVTATFFFGYTYWQRAQAKWFDDAGLATGFEGYAFLTWITRP